MGLTKEQKYYFHLNKNKGVISKWEEQLQGWNKEELMEEVMFQWSEQGLDGYVKLFDE